MGFFLGGAHDSEIDKFLEFMREYLTREGRTRITKLHVVYFALKYTALRMLGEDVDWRNLLDKVHSELRLSDEDFKEEVEKILNKFRAKIIDEIRRDGI